MAKIYAPNTEYTGLSASIVFINGVAECDNPNLIEWFRKKGYRIDEEQPEEVIFEDEGEPEKQSEEQPEEQPEEPEPAKRGRGRKLPEAEEIE